MHAFIEYTFEGEKAPAYATEGASGLDLRMVAWRYPYNGTHLRRVDRCNLDPGERILAFTGLRVAMPVGIEAHVRPRSGFGLNHGVGVVFFGTIDADYRGEIGATIINLGDERVTLEIGDRVAQLVFAPVVIASLVRVDELSETVRGEGGFGSTGKR